MLVLRNFLGKFAGDARGVVTVEFLIGLPLIFAAFVTAYELGRALWAFDVMTSDVESGLRYLTHTPATASDITAATKLVRTGSTTGTTDKSPWTWAVPSPTISVTTASGGAGYNQGMTIITMSTAIPITLPFLNYITKTNGNAVTTAFTLRVSDQAACIAGVSTPCGAN